MKSMRVACSHVRLTCVLLPTPVTALPAPKALEGPAKQGTSLRSKVCRASMAKGGATKRDPKDATSVNSAKKKIELQRTRLTVRPEDETQAARPAAAVFPELTCRH